jgi:hypothetical protein
MEQQTRTDLARRKAQRSLERMLEKLGPFLPKPTTQEPETPDEWRLADGATKVENTTCEYESPY